MVGKKEVFSFRQLINQYIIIKDDDQNLNVVGTAFQHEARDNAILTYCSVHPSRGIVFEVLAMARITATGIEEADSRVDIREANPSTSFVIEYNSVNGVLMEFKPNRDWPLLREFDNKLKLSKSRDEGTPQEVRDMREVSAIDKYRHDVFPDDLAVTFIGKLPKPEAIWCKGILTDDGDMRGRLLNEPWDSSLGLHEGDVVDIEIRTIDGKEALFARLQGERPEVQKSLSNELGNLKEILKNNPEFCTDSVRFNELVGSCNLSERLKDNLLLCIEDDVVERILQLETYTDDIVATLANQLTNDCNMNSDQAVEAVLWWMNILELDEAGRKERNVRLQKAVNPFAFGEGNIPKVEAEIVKTPEKKVALPQVDILEELDLQLKELISKSIDDDVIDAEFKEVPDVLSSIQSQLDELIEEIPKQKVSTFRKETRSFMSLQQLIEVADFQFPIDVQAQDWGENKHMQIETIRGDLVYGSIYEGDKFIDMERVPLKSGKRYALYNKNI